MPEVCLGMFVCENGVELLKPITTCCFFSVNHKRRLSFYETAGHTRATKVIATKMKTSSSSAVTGAHYKYRG